MPIAATVLLYTIAETRIAEATFPAPSPQIPATTREALARRIDETLAAAVDELKIPGLAVGVRFRGETLLAKGYGRADLEHDAPVSTDTVFQLASASKQFLAHLFLLWEKDGKLTLDDPLRKHIPEGPEAWDKVTLRHLLQHTAGLGDYLGPTTNLRLDISTDQLIETIAKQPVAFAPGEQWEYSNSGYALLGVVADRVGGKPYHESLRERLFLPAGMASTDVIDESRIVPHRARGYEPRGEGFRNQQWVAPTYNRLADGSITSTIKDLLAYDAMLAEGKVFPTELLARATTPARLANGELAYLDEENKIGYGLGWIVSTDRPGAHEHGGAWQGFTSLLLRDPAQGLCVIILANRAGARVGEVRRRILAAIAEATSTTSLRL